MLISFYIKLPNTVHRLYCFNRKFIFPAILGNRLYNAAMVGNKLYFFSWTQLTAIFELHHWNRAHIAQAIQFLQKTASFFII